MQNNQDMLINDLFFNYIKYKCMRLGKEEKYKEANMIFLPISFLVPFLIVNHSVR